jgi:stress-induced morphogen
MHLAMISKSELERLVKTAFPDATVEARDLTGTSDHYELQVVTEAFRDRSTVERHRLVHEPLGEVLKGPLHALILKTYTPDEKR